MKPGSFGSRAAWPGYGRNSTQHQRVRTSSSRRRHHSPHLASGDAGRSHCSRCGLPQDDVEPEADAVSWFGAPQVYFINGVKIIVDGRFKSMEHMPLTEPRIPDLWPSTSAPSEGLDFECQQNASLRCHTCEQCRAYFRGLPGRASAMRPAKRLASPTTSPLSQASIPLPRRATMGAKLATI